MKKRWTSVLLNHAPTAAVVEILIIDLTVFAAVDLLGRIVALILMSVNQHLARMAQLVSIELIATNVNVQMAFKV